MQKFKGCQNRCMTCRINLELNELTRMDFKAALQSELFKWLQDFVWDLHVTFQPIFGVKKYFCYCKCSHKTTSCTLLRLVPSYYCCHMTSVFPSAFHVAAACVIFKWVSASYQITMTCFERLAFCSDSEHADNHVPDGHDYCRPERP